MSNLLLSSLTSGAYAEMKSEQKIKLIPRKVIFGNPVKANPRISPDGKKLAYLAPVKNVMNIWVKTAGKKDDHPVTHDKNRGIHAYFWAQDNEQILYVQDTAGNENWRLYSVDLETKKIREFTPFKNVQIRLLDYNKHFPKDILIEMNKRHPAVHDAYHLDLPSGKLTLREENPGDVVEWITDNELKIRGKLTAREDGGNDLWIRETEKSEWRKWIEWNFEDSMLSGVFGFDREHRFLYLRDSRKSNTAELAKMELKTGRQTTVAKDPEYDLGTVLIHPDTYEIQMVSFEKEKREWQVLDSKIAEDIRAIQKLGEGDFFILGRDNKLENWIIGFTKDDGPVNYFLYHAPSKKGSFLFTSRPDLEKYRLAKIKPIVLKARDGLTLHGYLTLPPGLKPKKLPLVLNVHGGPWSRSTWGYDPEAQWLVNRGYVCLDINFRGSSGYGKFFLNAGNKEWGRKMHEDLVDAVHWAVQKGIADPKRLAIYGGSYGGYAALVGATFTPDLFRCAVSIVGPSNLITFIQSTPPYWKNFLANIYKRVGHPKTGEAFLKSRSPLFKVDQIKIPILIAQGANDPRVKRAESEQIVEAMKKKGIDHQYLLFKDEGHGFVKASNRLKFYAEAEKFLAKHLGGRYEK